jgi:hypothetical protein
MIGVKWVEPQVGHFVGLLFVRFCMKAYLQLLGNYMTTMGRKSLRYDYAQVVGG